MSIAFLPGLRGSGIVSPMNQAVLAKRSSNEPIESYKHNLISGEGYENLVQSVARHPLKQFQKIGIHNAMCMLGTYQGCFIADDMGLGKTIEAIVLSECMRVQNLLIVVEAKTLIQWQAQYYKWTGKLLTTIKTKKDAAMLSSTLTPFVICSYDMLDAVTKANQKWDMVIYDEIQKLRSRNSKMSLAARDIRDSSARWVVGLTGTLQWGYVRDLWNPIRVTFRYLFGTADEFDFTYCGAFINEHGGKDNKGYKSSDGIDRSEELAIRLSYVSVRRTRVDVKAELPAFTRNVIRIPCTQKATIALHAFLRKELPYMNAIMSTSSEKTEPVLELLETLTNAIIFTWTNADVALLTALIMKSGRAVYSINKGVSKSERVAIIQRAATEKATIVATIDSIGVGVDGLQHVSSNVIFHSLSHSPKLHLQAESRAFRMGQTNPVVITYFVMQDSADELVISILEAKSSQDGASATESDKIAFTGLKMDDAAMRQVLADWVKNATDEIEQGNSNSEGWSDNDDSED